MPQHIISSLCPVQVYPLDAKSRQRGARKGLDKLDLTESKEVFNRSSVPRARNELKLALIVSELHHDIIKEIAIVEEHQDRQNQKQLVTSYSLGRPVLFPLQRQPVASN
ncbi:hypothetical protein TNCV_2129791 [Trichonephila clavipes]|nr:hypothetical protein TNCV_2129791 [Trichonephila clavipes]